jgi:hypothetical protein
VQRSDYTEVMMLELQKAVEQGGGVRTLDLIDRLEEMEPGALWEDTKAGFDLGIRHHSAWQRTALVTDQGWIPRSARLLAWMAPGEFKVFPVAELEEAKAWIPGRGAAGPIFGGPRIRQLARSSCP